MNTCDLCVFLLSFLLLHLDSCLNYSVYVLSPIKIYPVHADNKFHVETCIIWIVKQYGEGASAHTAVQTFLLPYFFLDKHLPRQSQMAPEHSHLCLGNQPWVLSFSVMCLVIQKSSRTYMSLFRLTCTNKKASRVNISYYQGKKWHIKLSLPHGASLHC